MSCWEQNSNRNVCLRLWLINCPGSVTLTGRLQKPPKVDPFFLYVPPNVRHENHWERKFDISKIVRSNFRPYCPERPTLFVTGIRYSPHWEDLYLYKILLQRCYSVNMASSHPSNFIHPLTTTPSDDRNETSERPQSPGYGVGLTHVHVLQLQTNRLPKGR